MEQAPGYRQTLAAFKRDRSALQRIMRYRHGSCIARQLELALEYRGLDAQWQAYLEGESSCLLAACCCKLLHHNLCMVSAPLVQ